MNDPVAARLRRILLLACCTALLLRCGGSPSSPSPADATITITGSGIAPTEVRIFAGQRVLFVNNDVRPHE
jgi:hypothetical protein